VRAGPAFGAKLFARCVVRTPPPAWGWAPPQAKRSSEPMEPEPSPCIRVCVTRCASSGVTTITISHNLELRAHHTHELQLNGSGVPPQLKPLHHGADEEGGSASSGEVVGGEM
jgi:hypothetical protein